MDQNPLDAWGWDEIYQEEYESLGLSPTTHCPGRIVSQREDTFTLATPHGLRWAHPAGVLFHRRAARERPGVGDWVVLESVDCEVSEGQDTVPVTHSVVDVLPRRSCFLREAPGGRGEAQVVATNVDQIFVVNAADDLNLNRIERFAVAICGGGAEPAVILSKGDLVPDEELQQSLRLVAENFPTKIPIYTTHDAPTQRDEVVKSLKGALIPGRTYALVGVSGAGKSTLVNALMEEQIQQTGEVREGDHKGRHTTSFRELFALPNGALIMDTPGVREFALWPEGDGLNQVFADIEELAEECRFSDCAHATEPGCRVRQEIESGTLSERRFLNWQRLP